MSAWVWACGLFLFCISEGLPGVQGDDGTCLSAWLTALSLPPPYMQVWLCGMPHEFSEEDVKAYWEECGPIESMDLLRFKDSGRFNGAAFVTFKTEVRAV